MHCALPSRRSRSDAWMLESSKPKYTVDSGHVPGSVEAAPALLQKPFTQSSSSAQSSSLLHFVPRLHAPASHEPPGPQSAFDAHGLHLLAWQTWPVGHWSSLVHSGAAMHAFALHRLPLPQSESSVHSTHLFSAH